MRRSRASAGLVAIAVAVLVVLVIAIVGAGGGQSGHRRAAAFAWLRPAAPPPGWGATRISTGATLHYPPGWKAIRTDVGTASVARLGTGGRIDGYLNATPKQGTETTANWRSFRPRHTRGEGAHDVRLLASATGLPFRAGRGSCVIDEYTTPKATYREIACLVSGHGSTAVVVAAAPTALWGRQAPALQRAVSSFTT